MRLYTFRLAAAGQTTLGVLREPWTVTRARFLRPSAGERADPFPVQVVASVDGETVPVTEPALRAACPPASIPLGVDDPRRKAGLIWEPDDDSDLPLAAPSVRLPAGAVLRLTEAVPLRHGGVELTYERTYP
jgi:hypothetical protein